MKIKKVYLGRRQIYPHRTGGVFYTEDARQEYINLVSTIGSCQILDSNKHFNFSSACYIGDRTAIDIAGTTFRKINIDNLTVTKSVTISKNFQDRGKIWYFGDNRVLTSKGIFDFDGALITDFNYDSITPGDTGNVYASSGTNIYIGLVNGDNIDFQFICSVPGLDQNGKAILTYGRKGIYCFGGNDNQAGHSSFIKKDGDSYAVTDVVHTYNNPLGSRQERACIMPDGNVYRSVDRNYGRGKIQKWVEGTPTLVGNELTTARYSYGVRYLKFLGNIVSGGTGDNYEGSGYGSHNYFVSTNGVLEQVQTGVFKTDRNVCSINSFIDEQGFIYACGDGTGTIYKTDKTFTDLNRKNLYLRR